MTLFNPDKYTDSLSKINLITINPINPVNPYNDNIPGVNVFNTLSTQKFDENVIPLLISLFEKSPFIYNVNTYLGINTITTIKHLLSNTGKPHSYNRENIYSFWNDIQNNNNNNRIIIQSRDNIKTILENGLLTRIYTINTIPDKYDFTMDILHEENTKNIIWKWEWGTFEIVLYPTNGKYKYQLNINVIEDNTFITSRLEHINHIQIGRAHV